MELYYPVAVVTLLSGALYFFFGLNVARMHALTGILAPAMTGDPRLERAVRIQYNTLEWMPIFLPSLWLFAIYWSPNWAAALGVVWLAGRVIYFLGYSQSAEKRRNGFLIQTVAATALLLGALGRILYLWLL